MLHLPFRAKDISANSLRAYPFALWLFFINIATVIFADLQICPVQASPIRAASSLLFPINLFSTDTTYNHFGLCPALGEGPELPHSQREIYSAPSQLIQSIAEPNTAQFPPLATGEPYAGRAKQIVRDNVPGNQATFTRVKDIAVDSNQNVFLTDLNGVSPKLRKYDARTGYVTTFSQLNSTSICVDKNNNIYGLSSGTIDRVDGITGAVTHIASFETGGLGGDGGPIDQAVFGTSGWNYGGNLKCTSKGTLLIWDKDNFRIRQLNTQTKNVTTVVGNGSSTFNGDGLTGQNTAVNIGGFAIDQNDNIFLLDASEAGYSRVRRIDSITGITTTVARVSGGNPSSGFGSNIAVAPDGTIYVWQFSGGLERLDVASSSYLPIAQWCGPNRVGVGDGPLSGAHFWAIQGVQFYNDGTILVLESWNQDIAVRKIGVDQSVKTIVGVPFPPDGQDALSASFGGGGYACDIRFDPLDNMYFSDYLSQAIFKVDSQSHLVTTAWGGNCTSMQGPQFDVDSNGSIVTTPPVSVSGSPYGLHGLFIDKKGEWLYVAEQVSNGANIIERVNLKNQSIQLIAGAKDKPNGFSGDGGLATQAQFNFVGNPVVVKMILDADGNLLISDGYNNRVRKIDLTTGIVTTIAGNGTAGYSGDAGNATNAQLFWPDGLALDQAGNIYVGDSGNFIIRKIDRVSNRISSVATNLTRTDLIIIPFGPGLAAATDSLGRLFTPNQDYQDQILVFRALGFDAFLNAAGGASGLSLGQGSIAAGYGLVSSTAPSPPAALANFGYTQNGMLTTEAGVTASVPTTAARVFVDYSTANGTDSGVAVVNPSSSAITLNVQLNNAQGIVTTCPNQTVAANGYFAVFANQLCPNITDPFLGTLTLTSPTAFAATNLQMGNNSHGEALYNSLPVATPNALPSGNRLYFSQFADGGGYSTEILLMNLTGTPISGTVSFFDNNGYPATMNFGLSIGSMSTLNYSIPGNGMQKFTTTGSAPGTPLQSGSVVVTSVSGALPSGEVVFSCYNGTGGLASVAGVLNSPLTTYSRMYVEKSTSPLTRATGVAIVNPNSSTATVQLNLVSLDGSFTASNTITIPANNHVAAFIDQSALMGSAASSIPSNFQGAMTLSSDQLIAPVTLRLTTNERGEDLYSTLPVVDLNNPPTGPLYLPQIADGGGYTTQVILVNTSSNAGTVHIDFLNASGQRLPMPIR